jgi:hypothetical protein
MTNDEHVKTREKKENIFIGIADPNKTYEIEFLEKVKTISGNRILQKVHGASGKNMGQIKNSVFWAITPFNLMKI